MNKGASLAADASRRASLLVTYIRPVCALLAPRRAGASTPSLGTLIHFRVLTSQTDSRRSSTSHLAWAWRSAGAAMAVGVASIATTFLLPLAVRTGVRVLTLTMDGCVWLATEMSAGAGTWTIVSAVGRAASDALATGTASSVLLALTAAGALAFY